LLVFQQGSLIKDDDRMATLGRTANPKTNASALFILTEELAPYLLMILIGFALADLGILGIRDLMLPQKAPPAKPAKQAQITTPNKAAYQTIIGRNIFSSDGIIPEPLAAKAAGKDAKPGMEQVPVLSQLPLNLVGTMVLTNPARSIADIDVKSKNQDIAVMPNHDIDNIATLIRVERNRAILRNLNNGRLEYIEIKSQSKLSFNNQGVPAPVARGTGEVKQLAPNKFKLSRSTIMKHTSDLSSLLMQASTIPRRKANGDIECYILTSFQPNSIFADLGVQQGDCIKSVNGEPIDSPAKAMELYNALKTTNTIKLTVESDGRDVEKEYNIE
jgi:general secretion pathway protein C